MTVFLVVITINVITFALTFIAIVVISVFVSLLTLLSSSLQHGHYTTTNSAIERKVMLLKHLNVIYGIRSC